MEVRPGYKRTEVGIIPEDWNLVSIETITTHIGDGLHGTPVYSTNGEYFFINGNNLNAGRIVFTSDTRSVDRSEYIKHRKPLNDRTILLSINGTIGNLGLFAGEPIVLGKSAAYLNVKPQVSKQAVCLPRSSDAHRQPTVLGWLDWIDYRQSGLGDHSSSGDPNATDRGRTTRHRGCVERC